MDSGSIGEGDAYRHPLVVSVDVVIGAGNGQHLLDQGDIVVVELIGGAAEHGVDRDA